MFRIFPFLVLIVGVTRCLKIASGSARSFGLRLSFLAHSCEFPLFRAGQTRRAECWPPHDLRSSFNFYLPLSM